MITRKNFLAAVTGGIGALAFGKAMKAEESAVTKSINRSLLDIGRIMDSAPVPMKGRSMFPYDVSSNAERLSDEIDAEVVKSYPRTIRIKRRVRYEYEREMNHLFTDLTKKYRETGSLNK